MKPAIIINKSIPITSPFGSLLVIAQQKKATNNKVVALFNFSFLLL
jgi:hypothetical protein